MGAQADDDGGSCSSSSNMNIQMSGCHGGYIGNQVYTENQDYIGIMESGFGRESEPQKNVYEFIRAARPYLYSQ